MKRVTLLAAGIPCTVRVDSAENEELRELAALNQWPIIHEDLNTGATVNLSDLRSIDATNPGRTVSALCVDHKTAYRSIADVRYYDDWHDASTFDGATPIVAHPPCRAWSYFLSHQAKPLPGEKELGLMCARWLKECGGVLEHPARSHLFAATGLPLAGQRIGNLVTVEILQSWFGFELKKRTWLCFSHIDIDALPWPFSLRTPSNSGARFQKMTSKARSHTVPALAHWLVNAARQCTLPSHAFVRQLEPDPRPPIRPQQPSYALTCTMCGKQCESHREHADTCGPTCRKRKSRRERSPE